VHLARENPRLFCAGAPVVGLINEVAKHGIVERVSRNFAPLGAGFALWAENNLKTRGVSNWHHRFGHDFPLDRAGRGRVESDYRVPSRPGSSRRTYHARGAGSREGWLVSHKLGWTAAALTGAWLHPDLIWVDSLAGFLGLVEMDVVEVHPWTATVDDIENADMLVFDLDPGQGVAWEFVFETAFHMRTLLEDEGLEPWPKLTGGKGLHLVAPLSRKLTPRMLTRASSRSGSPAPIRIATSPRPRSHEDQAGSLSIIFATGAGPRRSAPIHRASGRDFRSQRR
jgi:hypothetical protein